jgi:hypothetical protein
VFRFRAVAFLLCSASVFAGIVEPPFLHVQVQSSNGSTFLDGNIRGTSSSGIFSDPLALATSNSIGFCSVRLRSTQCQVLFWVRNHR